MTWDEMRVKYPEYKDEMTEERMREFVKDCFDTYEQTEKVADTFWELGGDFPDYVGKPFQIIGRVTEEDADLECLPMWKIRFEDGKEMEAYPEEIFEREQKENGRWE